VMLALPVTETLAKVKVFSGSKLKGCTNVDMNYFRLQVFISMPMQQRWLTKAVRWPVEVPTNEPSGFPAD